MGPALDAFTAHFRGGGRAPPPNWAVS